MKHSDRIHLRINHQIRVPSVRLVDATGTMLGVVPTQEALSRARTAELDLVEVSPQSAPPVCKILSYSKYLYDLEKKSKDARKKQKAGILKEIQISSRIASHDLDTKVRHADEFLKKKEKVRFTVVFFGRENQHKDLGQQLLVTVKSKLSDVSIVERDIHLNGNRLSVIFSPKH